MSQLPLDKTDKISSADSRSFDAIRLLANYMIVLMHAWAASQYCVEGTVEFSAWNYLCNSFAAAAMPALFLMSGYLLMVDFTPQVARGKFYRRFKRLLDLGKGQPRYPAYPTAGRFSPSRRVQP